MIIKSKNHCCYTTYDGGDLYILGVKATELQ